VPWAASTLLFWLQTSWVSPARQRQTKISFDVLMVFSSCSFDLGSSNSEIQTRTVTGQRARSGAPGFLPKMSYTRRVNKSLPRYVWATGTFICQSVPPRTRSFVCQEYHTNNSGKLVLESKAEIQARGEASPDDADAFCLTCASPVAPASKQNYEPSHMWEYGHEQTESQYVTAFLSHYLVPTNTQTINTNVALTM